MERPPSEARGVGPAAGTGLAARGPPALLAAVALTWLLWLWPALQFWSLTIDDAFITFRQAEHLARGNLSYNSAAQPVEAASSILHSAALAALFRLGLPTELAAKLLGLFSILATGAALALLFVRLRGPRERAAQWLAPLLASSVLATSFPISTWWFYGLETPLWFALCVWLPVSLEALDSAPTRGRLAAASLCCALAVLCRPEGALVVAAWLFGLVVLDRGRLATVLRLLSATAVAFALVTGLRLAVYHQVFPNSVYAKVHADHLWTTLLQGARYTLSWLSWDLRKSPGPALLWLLALGLALAPWLAEWLDRWRRAPRQAQAFRRLEPRAAPFLVLAAVIAAYTVSVGGDWMPRMRFLAPAVILLPLGLLSLEAPRRRLLLWGPVLGAALAAGLVLYTHPREREAGPFAQVTTLGDETCQRPIARYLRAHATADETLSAADIGRVGYAFPGTILDYWGLADKQLTRSGRSVGRATADDVLRGDPEWLLTYAGERVEDGRWVIGTMAPAIVERLLAVPSFRDRYQVVYQCEYNPGRWHVLLRRR